MVIVDTGPVVALLDADDRHHRWAREQFSALTAPLISCEAVLSEASFLLQRAGADPGLPAILVARGMLRIEAVVRSPADALAVGGMMKRYRNVPMSFADACLVHLIERRRRASVLTLDSDFGIYRQKGRGVIPLLFPD